MKAPTSELIPARRIESMEEAVTKWNIQFFFSEFLAAVEEVIHDSQLLGSICYVCLDHERLANLWTTIIGAGGRREDYQIYI